jgi:type I restriction enzyme S subunit
MKEGWEIKTLGEVCDILDKLRKPITKSDRVVGDYPYYGATGILSYVDHYIFSEDLVLLGEDGAKWGVGDRSAFIATGKYWVNNHAHVLKPKNDALEYNWLVHYLNGNDLTPFVTGMTVPKLTQEKMRSIPIPLPPLPVQQRIVSIIDKSFEAIDKAIENTQKNLQNAKELFESYLNEVFCNSEWEEKTFEQVCELIGGSQPPKDDFIYEPKDGYIRFVQVRDYRTDKYITYIPIEKARRFCSARDIMIGRYGPPIFGIFKGIEGAYNVALMKANVNEKICSQDFFFWFLNNNKLRSFVEKSSKRAAGQDGVRKELLDKFPVFLPPLDTQQTIVRKLDTLNFETKTLEGIYQQKLRDLEELKKSVLNKAFAGEL